ncbi:Hypothetical predicted protein [Mytilus galloprovincialis]|uniref:Calponin-homology (CH) domain-containing protein n=1 Tax=Mytilus galloprovincialis TaxID=29158 RepID=A0A8B6GGL4_MYTGA|nr:Hypothetical predicted protein [Mytilus galloprovincialis]
MLDKLWGKHTIDRFATDYNTKCSRFNSKCWCKNTEAIDAFSQNWFGENNWLVPPPNVVWLTLGRFVTEAVEDSGIGEDHPLHDLVDSFSSRLLDSRSDSTVRKYNYAFKKWKTFSHEHNLTYLPASPIHVSLYLVHLLDSGATYTSYLIVKIKKSKTDQYRAGDEVLVSKGQSMACPFDMLLKYEKDSLFFSIDGGMSVRDVHQFEKDRIQALKDEGINIQKKTFTKWANAYLEKDRIEIEDLFYDLADGKILMKLLEIVSGEKIGKPNRGMLRIQKFENVNTCLRFLITKVSFQ